MKSIYVEAHIRGSLEELWRCTQTPALHERWDLRFTHIIYLPRPDENQAQQFLYATRIGFGLEIRGEGESRGDRKASPEQWTSALKFWSHDPKSLIRQGSGYWKYIRSGEQVRFITGYDYEVRYGLAGRAFDRLVFRPMLGWATAWSFDRLRLWIEKGLDPGLAWQRSLVYALARLALALVWIYQGVVPKLVYARPEELALLLALGVPAGLGPGLVKLAGAGEAAFGLAFLGLWWARWPFVASLTLMILATAAVAISSPATLTAAFNPLVLNLSVAALSLIGLLSGQGLPSARNCRRKMPG